MNKGVLYKNSDGRYAISENIWFTSGDSIEIYFGGSWLLTRIEHNAKGYYAVGLPGISLDKMKARLPMMHP